MTPHDLLANFETLAEAPNGIQRLRELVLELAVRGKLVEQDPGDEPAAELLNRICRERDRLSKRSKKAKLGKDPLSTDGFRVPVPKGWVLVRFGDCIELVSGQHLGPTEYHTEVQGLPYLTGPADFGVRTPTPSRWTFETRAVALKGDILVTVKGAGIGKANVLDLERAAISRQLMAVRPILLDQDFTFLLIRSSFAAFQEKQVGIAIPGIGREDILCHPVLLPPLAEQRRVVARVDELMALLDHLEAKRQDREAARTAARDSSLAALREAPTPDEVETAWLRIQERFHELFATPEDVEPLRALVLELAVRGKLVEQDPRDEPASDLFIRIKSIKSKMAAKGDSKAIKSYPLLTDRDCPSKLPNTWTWCRLGEIVEVLDYKRIPINAEERSARIAGKSRDALFPYFGATQQQGLIDDYLFDDDLVLLGEDGAPFLDRSKSKAYSVSGKCWVNNHAHVIKGIETETKYLQHVLNTVDYAPYVTGTTRLKLNQAQMVLIPIPLPPLAEQRRIVARVDELMALLDRLSQALETHSNLAAKFAAAAVHHLEA